MGLDLADAAASPWSAAASSISGAVVYLDEGAAAAAAAAGGASMLFSLGAAAVCDLSEPRSTDGDWSRKADSPLLLCCVLTRPLSEASETLAAVLRAHPSAAHVTLLSALRESAQGRGSFAAAASALSVASPDEEEEEEEEESSVATPERRRPLPPSAPALRVSVLYAPIAISPLGMGTLILPPGSAAADAPLSAPGRLSLRGELPLPCATEEEGGAEAPLDAAASASALVVAHALQALAGALDVRWECFALGPLATAVARVVAGDSEGGGGGGGACALLLVDRTCDLLTPTLPSDSMLERVMEGGGGEEAPAPEDAQFREQLHLASPPQDAALPNLPSLSPPCASAREAAEAVESAAARRCRDAALAARKAALELLRKAGQAPARKPKLGSVDPQELTDIAAQLRTLPSPDPAAAAAAAACDVAAGALTRDRAPARAAAAAVAASLLAASAERGAVGVGAVLLAAAGGEVVEGGPGGPHAAAAAKHAAALTPATLRPLILAAYCLAGELGGEGGGGGEGALRLPGRALIDPPLPSAVERQLRAALQLDSGSEGGFERLRGCGCARRTLRALGAASLARAQGGRGPAPSSIHPAVGSGAAPSLLRSLAARVAGREEVAELLHVPSSLSGLLKSGLGLLGLRAAPRPKPGDSPACLIFVLGGVSGGELREAREGAAIAAAARAAQDAQGGGEAPQPMQLLLGGTRLLSEGDLAECILWPN